MKKEADNRITVYIEGGVGGGVNFERLFRALSLILSEDDLMEYLSSDKNNIPSSSLDEYDDESEVLVEKVANF